MITYQIVFLLLLLDGRTVAAPSIEFYRSKVDCESRLTARSQELATKARGLWEVKAAACKAVGDPA